MSYQKRVFAAGTVFSPEDNGVWLLADFNGDGSQDLVYIKTRNTGTGKIEIHASRNESLFQEHSLATGTAFPVEDQGTWLMHDWTGDGKADLVYIKTSNTGTNSVEVHVVDAASNYQKFALQTGTCFGCEDNGRWTMSSKGDLVFIKTRNCGSGKVEYHVASKASNYQQFTQHVVTDFGMEDNGTWCIAPTCSGDFADLYYIKTRDTGTRKVEVHAVSASSGWKSRLIDVGTSFEPEENGQWLMANFSHQDRPDLVYIKTRSCESGKVEVHVVEPKELKSQTAWDSSRDLALTNKTVLRGSLKRNDGSWREASINLDMFLGNIDGKFTWNKKNFGDSSSQTELHGSVLSAELKRHDGSWSKSEFDLKDLVLNNDGVFQATEVPILLAIPKDQEGELLTQLGKALTRPNFKIEAVDYPDGATVFYANAGAGENGTIFKTFSAEARASVMHLAKSKGKPIEQVSVDVFTVSVGATAGTYMGLEANVSLIKAEASIFDLNLGVGVDTGAGFKDDSLDVKVAGCGFTIGRKVSISVFGAGFGVDFGRLFASALPEESD
jgi:hypothetical protein